MRKTRPAVFRYRHFEEHVIVLCELFAVLPHVTGPKELMAERGLGVAHSTIGRWVLPFGQNMDLLQRGGRVW